MVGKAQGISRRQALIGAGMVGGGALATALSASGVMAASESEDFVGSWLVHVVPDDGSATHNVLYLVGPGGAIAAVSDNPPTSGSTGFGSWSRVADGQFISTFEQFAFAPNGTPVGILRVRTAGSVEDGELRGRASLDFQPAGSSVFLPQGPTHFSGRRISAVAP